MGEKLAYYRFDAEVNPCGILYNPFSAATALEFLARDRRLAARDLLQVNGKWVSLYHHGSFSDPDRDACLERVNARLERAAGMTRAADLLVVTWGTAWVYEHAREGIVVANCHKIPDREFKRYRLSVDEIVARYSALLPVLRAINPGARLLFTVSPIRHWRDGARGNQLSKAILLLAIEQLQERFDNVFYFPAYEIVLDELRDYRFYAGDMLHLSPVAVDYIWEAFKRDYLSPACYPQMRQVETLRARLGHRPLDPRLAVDREGLERQLDALVASFRAAR
jgi:hypothetical protein